MRYVFVAILLVLSALFFSFHTGNCVTVYVLGYSGKGITVPVEVCKVDRPGAYVDAEHVGSKFGESVSVAYKAFSMRHGPVDWGVIVKVKGPVGYVDGRSADIAIYSAIYSLAFGRKVPYATGRIGRDLYSVEGVRFVREKIEAVSGPVVIPFSNRDEIPEDSLVIAVKNLDQLDAVLSSLPS